MLHLLVEALQVVVRLVEALVLLEAVPPAVVLHLLAVAHLAAAHLAAVLVLRAVVPLVVVPLAAAHLVVVLLAADLLAHLVVDPRATAVLIQPLVVVLVQLPAEAPAVHRAMQVEVPAETPQEVVEAPAALPRHLLHLQAPAQSQSDRLFSLRHLRQSASTLSPAHCALHALKAWSL